jgi:NAD(P)-dependent dehydrogenase (short-subunit alcohol dehydrogenase family)
MSGKIVLITGASSGIGRETAKVLLGQGYTVYTAARRVEKMDDLKDLGAIPIRMDITKEEDIVSAFDQMQRGHGGVDILVNNAGFGMYGSMEDTTLEDARYQFEVNLFGLARLTQLVLPSMREKRWGKIVNISSMGGKIYTPLGSWYHATKHALEGWSDCLRIELAQFGIDVIVIEPGAIETEFGDVMIGPMMERSGNSAYSEIARAVEKVTRASYEKGGGSPPSVIANIIAKAIRAGRPKTRYVAGKLARPTMFMRKWFGDRFYDRMITKMMG